MSWSLVIRTTCLLLLLVLHGFHAEAAPQDKKKAAEGSKKQAPETIARDPYIGTIVIDAASGRELASDHPDATGYPASVVKLMNLLIVQERIAQGVLRLDDQVTATAEAAKIGGTQVYLKEGEVFSLEELLFAMMVESANDAATAIAIHVAGSKQGFVELMNRKAKELGMKSTTFASVHGLPPAKEQQHDRTTPRDLAVLSRALLQYPDTLNYTSTRERPFREGTFTLRSHNHLLGSFPGADGLKTGFIRAGGYNIAATAQRGDARVIAVVMGSTTRVLRDRHATDMLAKGLLQIAPAQTAPALPPRTGVQQPAAAAKSAAMTGAGDRKEAEGKQSAPAAPPVAASLPEAAPQSSSLSTVLMVGGGVAAGLALGLFVAMGRGLLRRR